MTVRILVGDALSQLRTLPDESVHCVVTSPPYWGLRAYTGEPGMIGLEPTFEVHLDNLVAVFREVRRVLRDDGTCWLNYGSAYASAPSSRGDVLRGEQSGIGGKARQGLWDRDFLSRNLCDGCATALLSRRSPDSDARRVPECPDEAEATIPARMEAPDGRAASSGCPPSGGKSALRSRGSAHCEGQSVAAAPDAPASSVRQSSPPLPVAGSQGQSQVASACPAVADASSPGAHPSVCRGCGCGIPDTLPQSPTSDSRNDSDLSSSALGSYTIAPHKPKDLINMPFFVAEALRADGWYLRSEIVWHKPSPMPESVTDRPTCAHEKLFLLSKKSRYFYDAEAVREPAINAGRVVSYNGTQKNTGHANPTYPGAKPRDITVKSHANLRNVWRIAAAPYREAHFATFPPALVEPCIKAGTSEKGVCGECGAPWVRDTTTRYVPSSIHGPGSSNGRRGGTDIEAKALPDQPRLNKVVETTGWLPTCECDGETVPAVVLDPFGGSGTTGLVADRLQRNAILVEISPEYAEMARKRMEDDDPLFADVRMTPA